MEDREHIQLKKIHTKVCWTSNEIFLFHILAKQNIEYGLYGADKIIASISIN